MSGKQCCPAADRQACSAISDQQRKVISMDWKEVKIFVSSTFNDMHAERDYLVTEVFPELSEWCEERRIRLTDIDLRWGVTREDAESGNTVRACLNCIDECRPFFLCFLGQRRGWVPELSAEIGADTISQYRELRSKLGIYSITEMEVEHATLAPMTRLLQGTMHVPEKDKALFFFRNDPFASGVLTDEQKKIYTNAASRDESGEDRRLEGSKEWISREYEPYRYDCRWDPDLVTSELTVLGDVSRGRLTDFTVDGKPLRDLIISEMKKLIEAEYPDNVPVSHEDPYDADALEQQLHSHTACFDFTGRGRELDLILKHTEKDLISWAGGESEALFITAPEGTGKTALLSKACELLQSRGRKVMMRSCGLTDKSMTLRDLYLSMGNEAGLFRASERDPQLSCNIDDRFLSDLAGKGYDTLIIDGIDHARGRERIEALGKIPGGFHLIISSDDPEEWRNFRFFYQTIELSGLYTVEERTDVIDQYLLRTLKKLDFLEKNEIITAEGASFPLYLRVVLNELRSYGSFTDLADKILMFGDSPETAFAEMIRDAADEYGEEMTGAVMGMLVYSRDGLSEEELMSGLRMLGVSTDNEMAEMLSGLRMFLRRIRPYTIRAGRRYDIRIKALSEAVRQRYGESESDYRNALIHIYEENLRVAPDQIPNEWNDVHGSHELLYQMEILGEWDGIRYALTNPEIFRNLNPEEYLGGYRNGRFFRELRSLPAGGGRDREDLPAGFSLDALNREDRERFRMLAEIFLGKAADNLGVIGRLYPHPYAPKCRALRAQEDPSEFFRFRDLFYEAIQFAKTAFIYERMSLECGIEDLPESVEEWERFGQSAGPVHSFLQYISQFGGDETDLSYQIEDMADSALNEYNGTDIAIREYRERSVSGS